MLSCLIWQPLTVLCSASSTVLMTVPVSISHLASFKRMHFQLATGLLRYLLPPVSASATAGVGGEEAAKGAAAAPTGVGDETAPSTVPLLQHLSSQLGQVTDMKPWEET